MHFGIQKLMVSSIVGTAHKQENEKQAVEQKAQAAEGPIKEVAASDAQRFGKDAITQAYLWSRMGKWYRENDVIVSETGCVLDLYDRQASELIICI